MHGSSSGWGGLDIYPRERLKSKRRNTGVPMICLSYCVCCCCVLCMHGRRSEDVCLIVALGMKLLLSRFDLLLCSNHTRTPCLLAQRHELETRLPLYCSCCCCLAAALYVVLIFLQHTLHSHIPGTYRIAHMCTYTQKHRLWLLQRRA